MEQPEMPVPSAPEPIIQIVRPVQPVVIRHEHIVSMPERRPGSGIEKPNSSSPMPRSNISPVRTEPIASVPESKKDFDSMPLSKKDFKKPQESKKKFDPEDEIEYDRDGDKGRWRTDEQVKELVIYRNEWGIWPSDVEDKSSKDTRTGLESYYETRYFKEGVNQKGISYSELYAKHRARKRVWLEEDARAGNAYVDASENAANVVSFTTRRASSTH